MYAVVSNSVTSRTVLHQAPLSMEFSKQEYWSGLPFSPPGDLPDPRIEPEFLASPALAGRFFTTEAPGKPPRAPEASLTAGVLVLLFPQLSLNMHMHTHTCVHRHTDTHTHTHSMNPYMCVH